MEEKRITTERKIKVGVMGGAGYTAGELLRILMLHPKVEVVFIHSESKQGELIAATHHDYYFIDDKRRFDGEIHQNVDVVFLCVGHHQAKATLIKHVFNPKTKIIDLSQDHRDTKQNPTFVWSGRC
ncbi:hypothetical protein [Caedibacter taeniospiralis]|jgi:N-acetyl-gamma-glutamyl-phosphate reductase|uniref:hypothetical protein n=1 Tax=Caedibacter taeniospiralis TaxID=28907 RepID=UPI0037BF34EC